MRFRPRWHQGFRLLKQIDVGAVREFRTTWDDGAVYATKNLERMRVVPVVMPEDLGY